MLWVQHKKKQNKTVLCIYSNNKNEKQTPLEDYRLIVFCATLDAHKDITNGLIGIELCIAH